MAGVRQPHDGQILDQPVEPVELQRQAAPCPSSPRSPASGPPPWGTRAAGNRAAAWSCPAGVRSPSIARYQLSIAVNPPGCDHSARYCCFSDCGILETSMCSGKVLSKNQSNPIASTACSKPGKRNAVMYCEAARWSGSSIRLFWKITGWGALTIASRVQPGIAAQRGAPGDRAAPVVADEREPLEAQRRGEREDVVDQSYRSIDHWSCGRSEPGEPALVGHDEEKAVSEPRRDLAPGAVQFREAVEQDHRRVGADRRQGDVQRHSGAQRNPPELGLPVHSFIIPSQAHSLSRILLPSRVLSSNAARDLLPQPALIRARSTGRRTDCPAAEVRASLSAPTEKSCARDWMRCHDMTPPIEAVHVRVSSPRHRAGSAVIRRVQNDQQPLALQVARKPDHETRSSLGAMRRIAGILDLLDGHEGKPPAVEPADRPLISDVDLPAIAHRAFGSLSTSISSLVVCDLQAHVGRKSSVPQTQRSAQPLDQKGGRKLPPA